MRAIMLAAFSGSFGRRRTRITQTTRNTAAITSTTATQVFGLDGVSDAATSPIKKAAATPTASVAPSAPR